MQKERWLKSFTDSKKIKSSRSFILEIVRGIWMNYCQHSAVTHPCNSCSLFKGNHTGWCWTQLRAEVCTESSLPVSERSQLQHVAAGFHWQALRSSQLTHRLEESVFHSHREIWLLTGLRRFLPWDRCRKKEHPMVYLHPFAVCYIQNSLQRPDWGRAAPISHQVSTTFLWQLLCFSHLDTNLLQKETIKVSSLWILLLFCSVQANSHSMITFTSFIYIYIYINQPKQLQINWINRGLL